MNAEGGTIDNGGFNVVIEEDLLGAGVVTNRGAGKITYSVDQTGTGVMVCAEGETFLNAGLTVARPVTVESNATFTVKATEQSTLSSLTFEAGSTLNIDTPTAGVTPIAVTTLTLPQSGTVTLTKNGGTFARGLYPIVEKSGITKDDVANLVPNTSELSYEWIVQGNVLVLAVDMGVVSGCVWTGVAGDGKLSTDGNWLNGAAPSVAGTDLDFSGVAVNATIIGDIDVTFGAVTMGYGVITFTGSFAATSFSDTRKVAVGVNSSVVVAGDVTIDYAEGDGIVSKVDAGGTFIVDGIITITGGSVHPVLNVGDGYIVAGGIVLNATLYSTMDVTTQKWAIGPSGITGQNYIWCLSNKANDCWIYPYTNDFTIAVNTVIRDAIDHHELNTTGYGDSLPHTITLNGGFADVGVLYIAGTGKVVVNSVPTAAGGKSAYSGNVTVKDTATLAINADKKLTTGTITFAAGTTLEVPSTGVQMGTIAFSGEGTTTLKIVGDTGLSEDGHTVLTSSSALPSDVLVRFALDASAVQGANYAWLEVSADGKSLVLQVSATDRTESGYGDGIWVRGSGSFSAAVNWKNGQVPIAGDPLDFSGVTANMTINCDDLSETAFGVVTLPTATAQVTVNGTLRISSMTVTADSRNFSVAPDSKLIVDGDVTLNSSSSAFLYIVHENYGEVEIGGKVIVAGKAKGYACYKCSDSATIAVKGIECTSSQDHFKFNAYDKNSPTVKWIVGKDGLGGSGSKSYWIDRGDGNSKHGTGAELKAAENFSVDKDVGARQILTLDTDDGKTITVNGEIYMSPAGDTVNTLTVKGSGTVICNYTQRTNGEHYTGDVVVTNTATLAINAGKKVTTGEITVNTNATLQVAQSGTVALGGGLTLRDGAALGFNYTTRNAPMLNLTDKTVTFDEGATTNVIVKISAGVGVRARYGKDGKCVLTTGGNFADATVSLAEGAPDWVEEIGVNDDGNIYAEIKSEGLMFIVR